MASFLIVGNCQIEGICKCLRALHPGGCVEVCYFVNMLRDFENEDRLLVHMRGFDFVIFQNFDHDFVGMLDTDMVRAAIPNAMILPSFLFSAFHPDIVFATRIEADGGTNGDCLQSPLGDYQSALTIYGYLRGLTVGKTVALFNQDIYDALGYTNMWAEAESFLISEWQRHGWRIEDFYMRWVRRGVFMHSSNHPKLYVLADIARMILVRAQVAFEDYAVEECLADALLTSAIWPVYPPIADAYGVQGSMIFRRRIQCEFDNLFQTLPQFVSFSHDLLKTVPRSELDCPRVRDWIANDTLVEFERRPLDGSARTLR
jgi:Polysaccharide biosynthesis enzyme WcbI